MFNSHCSLLRFLISACNDSAGVAIAAVSLILAVDCFVVVVVAICCFLYSLPCFAVLYCCNLLAAAAAAVSAFLHLSHS